MALQKAPSAPPPETAEAPEEKKAGGKKKLLMMAVPLVLLGVIAYLLFLKPSDSAAKAAEKPKPEPGVVLQMDSMTLNLAGGHFLKLGMALQFTKDGLGKEEKPDGSKASDIAINLLSNRDVAELSSNKARNKLKAELTEQIAKAYENEKDHKEVVMGLYLTEFVMQ